MPQNAHLEAINVETERLPEPVHAAQDPQLIHERAAELARTLTWLPNSPSSHTFVERKKVDGTTLFIPQQLLDRLKRNGASKGFVNWSEYARSLLIRGLDQDELGPLDRSRSS